MKVEKVTHLQELFGVLILISINFMLKCCSINFIHIFILNLFVINNAKNAVE